MKLVFVMVSSVSNVWVVVRLTVFTDWDVETVLTRVTVERRGEEEGDSVSTRVIVDKRVEGALGGVLEEADVEDSESVENTFKLEGSEL